MSQNGSYLRGMMPTEHSGKGWQDYLADKPFPPEYDSWNQVQQRHYERGRLRAAGAYLVYNPVPRQEPQNIVRRTNGLRLVPPNVGRVRNV